ncbi:MAG TPA: hypothetical protein VHR38_00240 [Solirubrobacterales bacterium]|nr:hypothetical protein [Solirubrobacterales bacterium]
MLGITPNRGEIMNADTPQTESIGDRDPAAYDFKFGAIGLGVMALVPIIFRIFV